MQKILKIVARGPFPGQKHGFMRGGGGKSRRLSRKNGRVSKKSHSGRYGAQAVTAPRSLCYLLDFNIL